MPTWYVLFDRHAGIDPEKWWGCKVLRYAVLVAGTNAVYIEAEPAAARRIEKLPPVISVELIPKLDDSGSLIVPPTP